MTTRRIVVSGLGALAATGLLLATHAQTALAQGAPVKIGELNSYGRMAAFAVPYRNGLLLAQDEINAKGGVLGGRKLELVIRDDGATPGDAVRVAEELVSRENVSMLVGTFLSNIGLAVSDFANQKKTLFLASEPLTDAITMGSGNAYTYRVRPGTFMQTRMLVDAVKAKGVKKWAIVAPNYEYGQSAAASFKRLIKEATPDAEVVVEQFPALGKFAEGAGATITALDAAKPDGIFNVLFGADLPAFVREGTTRGLFKDRTVVSLLTGEPEYMLPLKDETPENWIVTGYPWEQIADPAHKAFVDAYKAKYNDTPRLGSMLGYLVVYMVRDLVNKAGSTDTDKLIAAFNDMKFDTIAGPVTMRGLDRQSSLGGWVGLTTQKGGQGAMKDWKFVDGASVMFSEADVKAAQKK
jgi:branched-chain amino acid transport system substrate-binding protein